MNYGTFDKTEQGTLYARQTAVNIKSQHMYLQSLQNILNSYITVPFRPLVRSRVTGDSEMNMCAEL
jgi:hypothetical protein